MTALNDIIGAVQKSEAARNGHPATGDGIAFAAGFFFSFRTFIMLLSVRALGTDPQTGTEISIALNLLFFALVAFQTMGATGRSLRSLLHLSSVRWVLLFLVFSACSLTWDVAASIAAAIAYWCAMAADVAIVSFVVRSEDPENSIYSLMKGYVWGACAIAAVAWLLPAQSDLRLGDEELLGTNQIGYLCGFAFFFAQYLLQQKLGRYLPAAILLGVTLLRSLSKTTIVAFLIAEGFLLLRDNAIKRSTKIAILACVAATTALFWGLLASYATLYSNTGNSPETLTGRLGIWAYIFEEAIEAPWIGHGFYSVWKVIPPFGAFEARHAHNELLQQFYLYGVSGLVLIAGLYGSFYLQVRRFAKGSMRAFFVTLLIFVLIRGLADTEITDFSLPLWAILLFSVLLESAPSMRANFLVGVPSGYTATTYSSYRPLPLQP